jgi:hypothetical protein
MRISVESGEVLAVDVSCSDDSLIVALDDGRTVSVPLVWFPRLLAATPQQRRDWESIGGGIGMHWEAIDEDISVASLLQPERFMRLAGPVPQAPTRGAAKGQVSQALSSRGSRLSASGLDG